MAKRSSKSKSKKASLAAPAPKTPFTLQDWILVSVIAVVTAWIYWPALSGDWIGDDVLYFTRNPLLIDPDRLWKAWFEPGSFIEYYPLEQTIQWLQWQLWGKETFWYHVTNVALHISGALLVWRLLHKLGVRLAWLGGLIFAIHPMQVESVALINELKNTLSLPLFLLALCCWVDFENRRETKYYLAAIGFFLAAMLSKISMAPFPLLILLYAWYWRGRIGWSDLKLSAPFFVISIVLGMMTIRAGQIYSHASHLMPADMPLGGFLSRLALAGSSLAFYVSRCFLPIQPQVMYPQWVINPPSFWQFLPWPALAGFVAWFWMNRATWGRYALLGLGFFLLFIAPFLGFNEVSYMATVWVMDHFLYIPIIGFIGLTCAALIIIHEKIAQNSMRLVARAAGCLALALLAWESHSYAAKFVDEDTIDYYTIEVNPQAWLARFNLGVDLVNKGKIAEARDHLEAAAALYPHYARTHLSLGTVYGQLGRMDDAQKQFEEALRIDPGDAQIYAAWGRACLQSGLADQAIEQFHSAIRLDPNNPPAHMYLGIALCQKGDITAGLKELDESSRLDPTGVEPYLNRGVALQRLGRTNEAETQFEIALQLEPDNTTAQNYLARLRAIPTPPDHD